MNILIEPFWKELQHDLEIFFFFKKIREQLSKFYLLDGERERDLHIAGSDRMGSIVVMKVVFFLSLLVRKEEMMGE